MSLVEDVIEMNGELNPDLQIATIVVWISICACIMAMMGVVD